MSRLRRPDPVKPVIGIFSADRTRLREAADRVVEIVGALDYAGPELLFDQTEYYRAEMGRPLFRRFFSAETVMDPGRLVDVKLGCAAIEAGMSDGERRTVNLDPGYISPERLVLATGKNFVHRIYLDRGVYADLTLIRARGGFSALPWTYPDYQSEPVLEIMEDIRKKCLEQLRSSQERE